MIITGMAEYESVCKNAPVEWYNAHHETNVSGDGIYAEYTYNGDKQELYEDVYGKLTNRCITQQ